jgi:hypothetical protein
MLKFTERRKKSRRLIAISAINELNMAPVFYSVSSKLEDNMSQ